MMNRNESRWEKLNIFYQHPYVTLFVYALLITLISYISINTNSQIYDYPFHMARIVGLAQSIANGDVLPNLNFLFTHGSGYAVPMFYGNGVLYIPALVYLLTKVATHAFASYAFIIIWATATTSYFCLYKMTQHKSKSLLFGMTMAVTFPYFGFGMSAIPPLIAPLIYCIYKVIFQDKLNPIPLGIIIALMVQTHIISTLVLAISSVILVLLSINRLTLKKILSFCLSVVIAIGLSIGFVLQFIEQRLSQTFFVSWGLRDYPFKSKNILDAGNLFEEIVNYYFPLALIFLIIGWVAYKSLPKIGRQLLVTSTILLVATSNILPWYSVFRYTFLTVFQYSNRLSYFIPAFVITALFLAEKKRLYKVIAVVQIGFYLVTNPLSFLPNFANFKEEYNLTATNAAVMKQQNEMADKAFQNPLLTTYWASGSEYFNLDINHKRVQNGTINQFIYDTNQVKVENVRQGYNLLMFDVQLNQEGESVELTLPRIWYKGYVAEYSAGAKGTQPKIAYVPLTSEELQEYKKKYKPNVTQKALNEGRATISVTHSGTVSVFYKRTLIQILGFTLQSAAWLLLFYLYLHLTLTRSVRENSV
ncbi:TPA: hypothetical protein ACGOU9_001094 [Streptococcus suis]